MTKSTRNRGLSYLGTLAIAAVSLAAVAIPLAPAKAQIGVQVGPYGFGIAPPAYTYHPYSPPYPYAYYGSRYYGGYPYYRGYPYYGYPY